MPDAGPAVQSKSQQAYLVIKERITRHEYSPGCRLVLDRLASELDMSVVPVREAIRRLEAETLVTYEPNVGAHVSMVDDTQYRHSMEALSILEGAATALSAPLMTQEDIRKARGVNAQMSQTLDHFDPHTFTALNHQFHSMLFTRCPNPRLLDLVKAEWGRLGHLRDSTFSFVPGRACGSVQEHEQILRLIDGDAPPAEIESAARQHRAATLAAYLDHKHPDALPDPLLTH